MKEVTVHDFPRRRNQIDFAVVESPWGPLVNPPEEELWFLQSDTATIRIHNLTREAARVVLPAEVAREVVSPEPEFEPDGLAFFSLPGRGCSSWHSGRLRYRSSHSR